MIRKCLIALTIMLIFGGSVAQAHEGWGVTTAMAFEWAKKYAEVNVYMKMVRWAELYVNYSILVVQQPEDSPSDVRNGWLAGDFVGCTWIEVCNNFTDLYVKASFEWEDRVVAPQYFLSLTESGYHGDGVLPPAAPLTLNPWGSPNSFVEEVVDDGIDGDGGMAPLDKATELNLTGNHGWLYLCMKLVDVDPQGAEFDPKSTNTRQKIGTILLTYFPNLAPTDADFNSVAFGTADPRFDDTINDPDVNWDAHTGGIPGQNEAWPPLP